MGRKSLKVVFFSEEMKGLIKLWLKLCCWVDNLKCFKVFDFVFIICLGSQFGVVFKELLSS